MSLNAFQRTKERKWFLSNAGASVTLKTLVRRHACRYWIERTFQDGKTSVGMTDYQVGDGLHGITI
jgi:SRSO17 transposase